LPAHWPPEDEATADIDDAADVFHEEPDEQAWHEADLIDDAALAELPAVNDDHLEADAEWCARYLAAADLHRVELSQGTATRTRAVP